MSTLKKINALEINDKVILSKYSKTKNNISKIKVSYYETIEKLVVSEFDNKPTLVVINNTNIITKNCLFTSDDQIINSTFPNLNIQDFYYEILKTSSQIYISICRKDYVDNILQELQKQKINVVGFSLGNLSISQLESIYKENEISTSNGLVKFQNSTITSIQRAKPKKTNYTINELEVSNHEILGFASLLGYITNRKKTTTNFEDITAQLQNDFKQQSFFDIGLKAALGFIFATLLISFLIFSSYNSKVEALQAELSLSQTQKASLLKLNKEVQQKENLVNELSSSSSKTSWYLDQLGGSIPGSISLTAILWQPLISSTIKEDKAIAVEKQKIVIQGISANANDFSEWTGSLERADWIKNITVNDYGIGKKTTTSFELEIDIE